MKNARTMKVLYSYQFTPSAQRSIDGEGYEETKEDNLSMEFDSAHQRNSSPKMVRMAEMLVDLKISVDQMK
jgi:hypothetical protein